MVHVTQNFSFAAISQCPGNMRHNSNSTLVSHRSRLQRNVDLEKAHIIFLWRSWRRQNMKSALIRHKRKDMNIDRGNFWHFVHSLAKCWWSGMKQLIKVSEDFDLPITTSPTVNFHPKPQSVHITTEPRRLTYTYRHTFFKPNSLKPPSINDTMTGS